MKPRDRTRWLTFASAASAAVALTCASSRQAAAQQESILAKVLRTHVLTVGTISGNPPWEFTRPDGQLDGYDIGIAKQLAADLGAKLQFVQTSGAGRIPALQTHKVDLVLAELDYTPLRAQTVAYTRAYANPSSQFIVTAASPYKTLESLNSPEVTLGYALGGDEANIWPKILPKAKLKAFTTVADAEQALIAGEVTATGEPTVLNIELMKTHPGVLRAIDPPYDTAITGIGVPRDDYQWWLYLDQWVENLNFSGENRAIWTKYVGGGTPLLHMTDTH
ncbi:MAG TPA: transporter substrate-binding domain-containing protein [Acetobacteraceae bacterium]